MRHQAAPYSGGEKSTSVLPCTMSCGQATSSNTSLPRYRCIKDCNSHKPQNVDATSTVAISEEDPRGSLIPKPAQLAEGLALAIDFTAYDVSAIRDEYLARRLSPRCLSKLKSRACDVTLILFQVPGGYRASKRGHHLHVPGGENEVSHAPSRGRRQVLIGCVVHRRPSIRTHAQANNSLCVYIDYYPPRQRCSCVSLFS